MTEDQDRKEATPPGPERRNAALAAIVLILLLLGLGLFLTHRLKSVSDLQDCVMAGRTRCAGNTASP